MFHTATCVCALQSHNGLHKVAYAQKANANVVRNAEMGIYMKIAIGNDHAAVELKFEIASYLEELGHEVVNYGTDETQSCDYPVYGVKVGRAVAAGEVDCGVLICGTGVGISLAANKVKGVRAVVCSEPYSAKLSRQHNDTNVLAFGARVIGIEMAKMIVDEWLNAEFMGGRHQTRVDMIMAIEEDK